MTGTANGLYYDTPFKVWSATQQTGHLNPVSKWLIQFDQEHDHITWTTMNDGRKPSRWSRQKQVTSLHITETCNNNRIKFCSHFTTSWGCCLQLHTFTCKTLNFLLYCTYSFLQTRLISNSLRWHHRCDNVYIHRIVS